LGARVLRLVTDPFAAPRARRCPLRASGLRRPRVVPADAVRATRPGARRHVCAPSTDDLSARRRELVELCRLAVAQALRAGPALAQSAASVPKS
jgi:hypothetical protein